MADKVARKKAYSKPEIRQIKLSLAELTLGTGCNINAPNVDSTGCPPLANNCNV